MNVPNTMRIGIGFDVHSLKKNNSLIIGGVVIPSSLGSEGHSDGDALIHAVVDALLGAAGLGDIGSYFPSSTDKWKNAPGKLFLGHAVLMIKDAGWEVENIDTNVILQTPNISEFIPQLKTKLSQLLHITKNRISVKAKTTDHLGFIGKEKGWAAQAIVLLKQSAKTV